MYTIEELKHYVSESTSIRQVLKKLGLVPAGGNYATFHRLVKEHSIDTSHFLGQGHNKNKTRKNGYKGNKPIPLSKILVKDSNYQSFKLKNRLLREGIVTHKCSNCKLTEWLGKPIPIELDHINGVATDNRLENLRLLCPNCHALTPTYCGKNIQT